MTTTRVLAKSGSDSVPEGAYGVFLFLANNLTGSTGPGWTVVEADDGTNRDTPSGPQDFSSLPASNAWSTSNTSTPGVGSWCVLESLDANNTNHFQYYMRISAINELQFRMFPFEDFATGGGSTGGSDPTFPSTAIGVSTSSNVIMSLTDNFFRYSCIADEGMAAIIVDNNQAPQWQYVGELQPFHEAGGDDRCYVIHDLPSQMYWEAQGTTQERFNRISPIDDTTALQRGEPLHFSHNDGAICPDRGRGKVFGQDVVWPVGIMFQDADHLHHAGWFRNVYAVNESMGFEGVLGPSGSADFYFRASDAVTSGRWPIGFTWDGVTFV